MRCLFSMLIVVTACLLPASASNPGEPLGCADWVLLEPGLSCETEIPFPCKYEGTEEIRIDCSGGSNNFDTAGDIFFLFTSSDSDACGQIPVRTYEIRRSRPDGSESVVASIQERCVSPGPFILDEVSSVSMSFDRINGRLVVAYTNSSVQAHGGHLYEYGRQRIGISGFATLLDVLQTFEPSPISFRVPFMPEGFAAASYFDTYYGDLATVGDWSKAQPLQCGYPTAPPSMGDFLTVADVLPDPPINTGRYYITAVNYMGRTRYGRKSNGRILMGRDPANLPACEQPEE